MTSALRAARAARRPRRVGRVGSLVAVFSFAAALVVTSCATSRSGDLDPRYVAVHNAFTAVGLTQIGPLEQGSLAEGKESRSTVDLAAQCVTLMGMGGAGVGDLDIALYDPLGHEVAHDTTHEPEAIVRACVDQAGTYALVVKMTQGEGDFVAATWSGGIGAAGNGTTAPIGSALAQTGAGTCESPMLLTTGTITGNTSHGESEQEGSCGKNDSKELVYRIELQNRQHAVFEVNAHFDSIIYVRKDDCADKDAEVNCNDDAPDQTKSRLDLILDPGTYFVVVDGYNGENGAFRLTTTLSDVPSAADVCRHARPLAVAALQNGTTTNGYDNAHATCGANARGDDVPYRLDVAQRSRVRVTETSTDFSPAVYVRRSCSDEQSEVGCAETGWGNGEATFTAVLDPATYTVWADAKEQAQAGHFTLLAESAPEQGSGASGDACGDAVPLRVQDRDVDGDTFAARDDTSSRCGGAGAGDVFYRIDVARRARIAASFSHEEGRHIFILSRACADRSGEINCGPTIDEALSPGTYFLAVDGAEADQFGRYTFDWDERDLGGQEAACRNPQMLVSGQEVNGNTQGAGDKWSTSCAGDERTQSSPDRMYKIVLGQRATVHLELSTPSWDGVLVVRHACVDVSASPGAVEVACNNDSEDAHHARIEQVLEPGTYYVLVDGHQSGNEGAYSLTYRATP